jgi:hypothetical protein
MNADKPKPPPPQVPKPPPPQPQPQVVPEHPSVPPTVVVPPEQRS